MAEMLEFLKIVLIVQIVFAFSITMIVSTVQPDMITYVAPFSSLSDEIGIEEISSDMQSSLDAQTDVPSIELGALVFYSGNILVDLLLNFLFAIPEMISLILGGILLLFGGLNTQVVALVEIFFGVLVSVLYILGLMSFLTSVRSGRFV